MSHRQRLVYSACTCLHADMLPVLLAPPRLFLFEPETLLLGSTDLYLRQGCAAHHAHRGCGTYPWTDGVFQLPTHNALDLNFSRRTIKSYTLQKEGDLQKH